MGILFQFANGDCGKVFDRVLDRLTEWFEQSGGNENGNVMGIKT